MCVYLANPDGPHLASRVHRDTYASLCQPSYGFKFDTVSKGRARHGACLCVNIDTDTTGTTLIVHVCISGHGRWSIRSIMDQVNTCIVLEHLIANNIKDLSVATGLTMVSGVTR